MLSKWKPFKCWIEIHSNILWGNHLFCLTVGSEKASTLLRKERRFRVDIWDAKRLHWQALQRCKRIASQLGLNWNDCELNRCFLCHKLLKLHERTEPWFCVLVALRIVDKFLIHQNLHEAQNRSALSCKFYCYFVAFLFSRINCDALGFLLEDNISSNVTWKLFHP